MPAGEIPVARLQSSEDDSTETGDANPLHPDA
jgi:hypothetical protein